MSSHPETPTSGKSLLLCFASLLLPLLLSSYGGAEGASFLDHRLRVSESGPPREPSHRSPDEDMLKALQHIENLRHRTGAAAPLRLQKPPLATENDAGLLDNAQALRTMLMLAAPGRGQAGGKGEEEEEEWEGEDNHNQGDKTQEWFQSVLRALEQTEPDNTAHRSAGGRAGSIGGRLRLGERAAASQEAMQLMFEDADGEKREEEEGKNREETADEEGEEEEEEEGGERAIPFARRTGEGVGEKYTPQKLATLQSIFDEVERMVKRGDGKEQEEGDEEELEEEGGHEKEALSTRSLAYDNFARGLADWAPLQRGEEEEEGGDDEEEEEQRGKAQADYSDDGEEEDDGAEEKDEEQEGESLSAKRSNNARPTDDADDMANLVDYYLLKVLEKTEEEDKRELDEEEKEEEEDEEKKREERKVSQFQYWDNRAPQQDMRQLIRLSQKYQIPPEDLLALLKAGEWSGPRSRTKAYKSSGSARAQNRITQKQQSLGSELHSRHRIPDRQSSYTPEDARTQEILNILGLGSVGRQDAAGLTRPQQHKVSQSQFQPQPRRKEKFPLSQTRVAPNKLKEDYNDVGEDELAAYLAAKILAQYPPPLYTNRKTGQKRSAFEEFWRRGDEEQGSLGSFEQTMQAQTQILDDDALMNMMTFLKPEGEASDEN